MFKFGSLFPYFIFLCTAPQDAIRVTAREVHHRVIDITWTSPSERNGSIGYNLSYTGTQPPPYPQEEAQTDTNSIIFSNVNNVTHTINNALPFAIYVIKVFAYNTDLGQNAAGPTGTDTINRTLGGQLKQEPITEILMQHCCRSLLDNITFFYFNLQTCSCTWSSSTAVYCCH